MPTLANPAILLASGSVVDLDATFLVQWGIFLLFFLILRSLIWKPFLENIDRRDQEITGKKEQAAEEERRAKERELAYQEEYRAAQNRATARRMELLEQSQRAGQLEIEKARGEAAAAVSDARANLQKQAEEARVRMRGEAMDIARMVSERILGRKVTS